jgi:5-methylcytosine-specific restriction protein A
MAVRDLVVARDGGVCVIGVTCRADPTRPLVINHRINRGMGGSTDPAVNAPSALIRCCNPCNLWLEDHPDVAYEYGWKVRRPGVPSVIPILYPNYRWYLLDNDGNRMRVLRSDDGA